MSGFDVSRIKVSWTEGIKGIPREQWNELAHPLNTPFMEWEWFYLMEESGSICPDTGWTPRHLSLWQDDTLIAAAPLYIKTHSQGEFVYDYVWAQVAGQLSIRYYPKLVGMSPVTPVPGYRFLVATEKDEEAVTRFMLERIDGLCRELSLSGVHFLYTDPKWQEKVRGYGFIPWLHQVFEWSNPGFGSFDDYLAGFKKSQRRNIRRERNKLSGQGITVKGLTGGEIPPHLFERMYDFYLSTNYKFGPWACDYLNRDFFIRLPELFGERVLFMAAYSHDDLREPLGMAMFFHKNNALFGRYWGSSVNLDSLHFNTCYYAPIEWSINRGIRRFDPGIGSEHKVRRGFHALGNYSLHRFFNRTLTALMQNNMAQINFLEQENIDGLNAVLPIHRK